MPPNTNLTSSIATPSSPATIWPYVVSWLWPYGICDVHTTTDPLLSTGYQRFFVEQRVR